MAEIMTISFSIRKELLGRLDRMAEDTQRTRSSLINEALRIYLEARESQEGKDGRSGKDLCKH